MIIAHYHVSSLLVMKKYKFLVKKVSELSMNKKKIRDYLWLDRIKC